LTKRERATKRTMASATRVACDKEGDGNECKSDGNEGDRQATVARAMAMATSKATAWMMVMATRLAGNKQGKGEDSKGDGDSNEGRGQ
jgi:hypothetical protein